MLPRFQLMFYKHFTDSIHNLLGCRQIKSTAMNEQIHKRCIVLGMVSSSSVLRDTHRLFPFVLRRRVTCIHKC